MDTPDEGLLYEGSLPISFRRIECFPEAGLLALINEKNENFLKTSLIRHEATELDEHDEIILELRRQNLKINLLPDLVAELLVQQNKLPPPITLRFTATDLEYESGPEAYQAGEKVEIALYITPSLPRALQLFGEVTASNNNSSTSISFVGLSQVVQDWLEKFIFRHHRRTTAQGRTLK